MPKRKQVEERVWITLRNLDRFKTQFEAYIGESLNKKYKLFKAEKSDLNSSDTSIIQRYFEEHANISPRQGDIFVIETIVDATLYEMSSYCYFADNWEAITGNVDADKVIIREDIICAGDYTQIGNIKKGINETKKLNTKGKSQADFNKMICTAKLQPTNITQPSISGFNLTGAKSVEAGTKLSSVNFGTAKLSPGSYQYGPETGVVAQSWKIDRVTNVSEMNIKVSDTNSGTDNNNGKGFIIGDQGGENVVANLKYTVTATHNEGVIAHDNLGEESNPQKKIDAGSKQFTTNAYTCHRNYFYGATSDKPIVDSLYIRTLTSSNKAYSKGEITLTVPAGSQRVAIACIASAVGVTKVINTSALNANVTSTFSKQTIKVDGADGYTSVDYNVWIFEPAEAYSQQAILKVTLG